jgi:hypothetical protein
MFQFKWNVKNNNITIPSDIGAYAIDSSTCIKFKRLKIKFKRLLAHHVDR